MGAAGGAPGGGDIKPALPWAHPGLVPGAVAGLVPGAVAGGAAGEEPGGNARLRACGCARLHLRESKNAPNLMQAVASHHPAVLPVTYQQSIQGGVSRRVSEAISGGCQRCFQRERSEQWEFQSPTGGNSGRLLSLTRKRVVVPIFDSFQGFVSTMGRSPSSALTRVMPVVVREICLALWVGCWATWRRLGRFGFWTVPGVLGSGLRT